ncbi:hypothetical protein [Rhizobium etli]|uniref:Uncharacterized protein n=1 Tax=Rhizobium etli TaxID=29449 RepID=A0A7W6ZMQ9_RHIET|nr:hypothetical protein [Rhizobium etli]MBB4483133.1 hypothetical protein [Rhizobium etli]MBB4538961.1 hypothetical protein [Rhizobium etli]
MTQLYYVGTCPRCDHQGRLYLQKDLTDRTLYAHCEECESGFRKPEDLKSPHGWFLTLLEDYETENPSMEEISRSVWAGLVVRA